MNEEEVRALVEEAVASALATERERIARVFRTLEIPFVTTFKGDSVIDYPGLFELVARGIDE